MCLYVYDLDCARFLTAPGIAWQEALKKTKVKLDLVIHSDMLLMIEKGIYWYTKANNKYIKDSDKNKESSYLKYWDINNLYGWTCNKSCL